MVTCGMRLHHSVWIDGHAACKVILWPAMKGLPAETDFVVLGAGIAGLRAAIELAAAGRVLVVAKKQVPHFSAQSPPASSTALFSDEDEVSLHLQDTLNAGEGLCNPAAAKTLVEE